MKKALALSMALAMSAAMLAGCGGSASDSTSASDAASSADSAASGTPTVSFMIPDFTGHVLSNEHSDEVIAKYEAYTGTHVEWRTEANDTYSEKFGLTLMDKDNMPMILTATKTLDQNANAADAAKRGAFWDLTEYLQDSEAYPNLSQISPDVLKGLTVDGQIIGIPRSRAIGRNGLGYRTDWAEAVGITEAPKTVEDVYDMLYKFTYDDPDGNGANDTYGLEMCKYTGPWDIIQTWFGCGNGWVEQDGKLVPVHQTAEYKEALDWMRKIYADGLVRPDWATVDTANFQVDSQKGVTGVFVDTMDGTKRIWKYFEDNAIADVNDASKIATMTSVGPINGHTLATTGYNGFYLITKSGAKTEEDVKGYTGRCFIDCYKLDGTLVWRLDMGQNIRAGAHYTQFMVYDFNGDGRAEMAVKTAPGTVMTRFAPDGTVLSRRYITMPQKDLDAGYSHADNYVCTAQDYRLHMAEVFRRWHTHPEVVNGRWPATVEQCFGLAPQYAYPLCEADALALADYFLDVYAPSRSPKNELRRFEGFVYDGPEYLTMFGGDGTELDTIDYPYPRVDDGLLWGDYAMPRIEPCNRVDRFNAGVAYLDGERPYLIACRGYYTRATLAAYDFFENRFHKVWGIDSGFVPMANPFNDSGCHLAVGTDPVYGILAGQGNHSISTADIDGDGCMEIVYGAAAIDHDGSLLYSKYGTLPDGRTRAKFGHGDAMHVADIDPDSPGLEIFNVYEEGERAPYGWALRDAETGDVRFGEYAEEDLGRCMIGKIDPNTRGLQVWVKDVYDVNGRTLELPTPGTNMKIYWAGDLSTQITDGADYLHGDQYGVINDLTHGVMLQPAGTATNNGTKGNPCLVADVLGDFREELLVRTADDTAIRIYTTTDLTPHKLFTLMHDAQYRCGVAWQNNCYNQPCYPSFYYAGDMDFANVLPQLNAKPTLWMAGDSIMQSYAPGDKPVTGWGEVLHTLAHGDAVCQTAHRADCPFPQEMRYELPGLVIDNCAMAGRSSKTFREEGRLDDIAAHIRPGDLLVVSFGHNDANRAKAERYVPADAFGESLRPFWDAARSHGAVCIFASPVAMREFDEAGVCYPSFAAYREAMRAFAAEVGAPFVDLGAATAAANTAFGAERCKARYMWVGAKQDNAHQQNAGACRTAQAFVQQLLQDTTPALDVLRANFK